MNKKAMDFTNRIVDGLPQKDQDDLEFSDRLCIYYMVKNQLDFGAILLSKLLDESNFNADMLMGCVEKLLELNIIDEIIVDKTVIYEVNLVSEETPCI